MVQNKFYGAKNIKATKLRCRKYEIIRKYHFPENILAGSLTLTYRRCGKQKCHCLSGKGHPLYVLSQSYQGKKYVKTIPVSIVEEIKPLIEQGRGYHEALLELLHINAQLFELWRQDRLIKKKK